MRVDDTEASNKGCQRNGNAREQGRLAQLVEECDRQKMRVEQQQRGVGEEDVSFPPSSRSNCAFALECSTCSRFIHSFIDTSYAPIAAVYEVASAHT